MPQIGPVRGDPDCGTPSAVEEDRSKASSPRGESGGAHPPTHARLWTGGGQQPPSSLVPATGYRLPATRGRLAVSYLMILAMIAFASVTVFGLIASAVLPEGTLTCSVK